MGRPPKYKTDAERCEARKRTRREYYDRNRSQEQARALRRYHAKNESTRKARASDAHKGLDAPTLRELLPHTVQRFGLPLDVSATTEFKTLAFALEADLRLWCDGLTRREAFEDLTTRLIAANGLRRQIKSVRADIGRKRLLVHQVLTFADEGQRAAWYRNDNRNHARLLRVHDTASDVEAMLEQLETVCNEGTATLRESYDRQQLMWQCM